MTARLLIEWLIPATLWLSFGSLVTWTILALTRCRQCQIHRLAWAAVILQGVVCGWVAPRRPTGSASGTPSCRLAVGIDRFLCGVIPPRVRCSPGSPAA